LVGGPNMSDGFTDDVNLYQHTEVALDYNAAFVGALAAVNKFSGNIVIPTSTPTSPSPTPSTPDLIWCDVGDLNADGSVNSVDITYMKRYLLRGIKVLPYQENERIRIPVADTNGDGQINSSDMALLKRYVLRAIKEFPVKYDIYGNIIN